MIQKIQDAFNRSFSFSKIKLLLTNISLLFCFFLFLFFKSVCINEKWLKLACFFLPLFGSGAILFCLGAFIQSIYEEEQGHVITLQNTKSYFLKRVWVKATKKLSQSLYIPLMPIFLFLGFWILIGIFSLLQKVPAISFFCSAFLLFLPFLLLFSICTLALYQVFLLFFILPEIQEKRRGVVRKSFLKIKKNFFQSLVTLVIALIPFFIFWLLTSLSLSLMPKIIFTSSLHQLISLFFLCLPILFLFSFVTISFFQFSYEMHLEEKNRDTRD